MVLSVLRAHFRGVVSEVGSELLQCRWEGTSNTSFLLNRRGRWRAQRELELSVCLPPVYYAAQIDTFGCEGSTC